MNPLSSYFDTSRAYLIAVQNYDTIKPLFTPLQDIDDIHDCLLSHQFDIENIIKVPDASKKDIENVLNKMQDEIGFRDRVLFYFAGHGIAHDSGDEPKGFLIPKEGSRNDETTFIDMNWLAQKFSRLRCKHFLLILDCCFAGSFRWADNYRDSGLDQTKKLYRQKFERFVSDETNAFQVITSSSYDEEAIDRLLNLGTRDNKNINNTNSPFAKIIIDVLKGKADNYFQDGIITTTRFYNYIDIKIAEYLTVNKIIQRQSPNYFPLRRTTKGQFIFLVPQVANNAIAELPKLGNNNPYKGLDSFKSTDSHLFFGRKRAINNLIDLFVSIGANEIILVSGSSGVGKSSLVMAGLIPAMLATYPDSLKVMPVRPGDIRNKSDYLKSCYNQIALAKKPFILFIDQFEEMVTICSKKEQALWEKFINSNLLKKSCRIVISMRSDFEPQLKENSIIKLGLKNRFVVPPLERSEIKDIILQPALQSVIQIEASSKDDAEALLFIDRICDEAMQSLGSLPLLSFALEQWYEVNLEKSANRYVLKEGYYNGIGGVNGALGTIIETFMLDLKDWEEEILKRLMFRMVTIQDDSFARVKVYDYELDNSDASQNAEKMRELLEELIKLRVVTTNRINNLKKEAQGQIYYEPAHDAVITSWKKLWEWLNAEKINIPTYHQLTEDVLKWKNNKYKSSLLWSESGNLSIVRQEFQNQINTESRVSRFNDALISTFTYGYRPRIKEKPSLFNLEERRFIRESLRKVSQNKARLNILYFFIVIAAVAAVLFGVNANTQKKQAISEARKNYANLLANNSDNQEAVTAFYSLSEADSLYPDNPAILQRIFNLFNKGATTFDLLPTNIIPLKNELYNLSFEEKDKLIAVNNSNSLFQINLNTGKILDLKKRSDLNFPDYPSEFTATISYSPEEGIIRFTKCDLEATNIITTGLHPETKFLMIGPTHVRIGKFLGIDGFINKDTCLSDQINFSQKIKYGTFLKDSNKMILICEDNSIYLADFINYKMVQLIKGYRMDKTSRFYAISSDKSKFAAVNSNKVIYVWDFKSTNQNIVNTTQNGDYLFKDESKLAEAVSLGQYNNTARYSMTKDNREINISLPSKPNDYTLLIARNPAYNEFIIYRQLPNRNYIITDKDIIYRIELPDKQNADRAVFIRYSSDGQYIFYTVYTDSILSNPLLQKHTSFPDSIISQFPSLNKIKSWIRKKPNILSDTLP